MSLSDILAMKALKQFKQVPSKNLFNPTTITSGYFLSSSDGVTLVANSLYFTSDFIPVSPNTFYTRPRQEQLWFYDSNKRFISWYGNTSPASFPTPANCAYVRIIDKLANLNTYQLEKGYIPTKFTPFGSVSSVGNFTIDPSLISGVIQSKNLFNPNTATPGFYVSSGGVLSTSTSYFVSDYIPVDPNTTYTRPRPEQMAFYDANKTFITGLGNNVPASFTTPSNCAYVRINDQISNIANYQLEKGSIATPFVPYSYNLGQSGSSNAIPSVIYKLNDAWTQWLKGNKFPIAFFGDSTIDGVNTTGYVANTLGVDSTSPNTFSKKLESALRSATNNSVLRVYNAGFSGKDASWGLSNINAEFAGTSAYNDVKMIGIGFGINDRLNYSNDDDYRNGFKTNIIGIINWCYAQGIQPFLLTSQAMLEPGVSTSYAGTYPLRTSEHINSIANEVKRELAIQYNLQLIDVNKFTEAFLLYSSIVDNTLIPDRLHFADVGHQYESDLLFYHLSPRSIYVDQYTRIDYSSQKITDSVPEDWLTMPTSPADSFKVYVNYTKADTIDTKIMTAYVFVNTRQKLTLNAYVNSSTNTHVKINGVDHTLTGTSTNLGQLEMGLYKLEVFTGASTTVDFKGFIIQ